MLLSLIIESAQLYIPGRYTQPFDVIMNGAGAWLGALIFVFLKGILKESRPVRIFTLELPLINLVYLLIPLIWLSTLSTGNESNRLWLVLSLGLFGSGVLSSIYIYRFKEAGSFTPNKLSIFTFIWFMIASLPGLLNFPLKIIIFGITLGLITQITTRLPFKQRIDGNRFELPTLKVLLPLYVIYLLLLAVWPITLPLNEWHNNTNFSGLAFNERVSFIFRLIEFVAAFTLLGYIIAEMRSRRDEPSRKIFGLVFLISFGYSMAIEIIKNHQSLSISDIPEMVLVMSASIYGALIYMLQRNAIQGQKNSVIS